MLIKPTNYKNQKPRQNRDIEHICYAHDDDDEVDTSIMSL